MPGDELYCYPGGDVLKNKLNITDDELLHDVERKLTAIRIDELLRRRVRGSFDFEHLKAIHFFIFQDLYIHLIGLIFFIGLGLQLAGDKRRDVKSIFWVIIRKILIIGMLGNVIFPGKKGPHTAQLQDALAAIHDGKLVHGHQLFAHFLRAVLSRGKITEFFSLQTLNGVTQY